MTGKHECLPYKSNKTSAYPEIDPDRRSFYLYLAYCINPQTSCAYATGSSMGRPAISSA